VKTEGDAFMVAFFTALEAILWCMAVQEALVKCLWLDEFLRMPPASTVLRHDAELNQDIVVFNGIRIRMGIHTGEPNCRRNPVTGRMDYFGPVVNRTSRVSDVAHGGQITITQEMYDILQDEKTKQDERFEGDAFPVVKDLGVHSLKGIKQEVRIYELLPRTLRLREFPPLRTDENERKAAEAKEKTFPFSVVLPTRTIASRPSPLTPQAKSTVAPKPIQPCTQDDTPLARRNHSLTAFTFLPLAEVKSSTSDVKSSIIPNGTQPTEPTTTVTTNPTINTTIDEPTE